MPSEWLFFLAVLLLPVAAFSGWYLARRDSFHSIHSAANSPAMSPDYFKGLNYLLNDRPDKAIEAFIKVLEVESETVETHLALGSLFRRRGEVDRAIRIHQNLVARPALDIEQRYLAVLELGVDYMRGGLLDRAESLFKELLDSGAHERQALHHLIDIYQQEKDWDNALVYSRRLESIAGLNSGQMRAHFLCEQAAQSHESGAQEAAWDCLKRAQDADANCVRASMMSAEYAMAQEHYISAIEHLKRIEHQDIDFLPEAIAPLVRCYTALDRPNELAVYLERLAELHVGITPVLTLAELTMESGDAEEAKKRLVKELKVRPTVRGIDRLIDYSLQAANGEAAEDFRLLKEVTASLIEGNSSYECRTCGFKGRSLHWQCPSCQSWNTVKPIHGIEGE
ncbi:MAG: lipopolysaccharide assembly protein LapB [Pseudomonadota bacterium]